MKRDVSHVESPSHNTGVDTSRQAQNTQNMGPVNRSMSSSTGQKPCRRFETLTAGHVVNGLDAEGPHPLDGGLRQ